MLWTYAGIYVPQVYVRWLILCCSAAVFVVQTPEGLSGSVDEVVSPPDIWRTKLDGSLWSLGAEMGHVRAYSFIALGTRSEL